MSSRKNQRLTVQPASVQEALLACIFEWTKYDHILMIEATWAERPQDGMWLLALEHLTHQHCRRSAERQSQMPVAESKNNPFA